jgi:hypothetical protein
MNQYIWEAVKKQHIIRQASQSACCNIQYMLSYYQASIIVRFRHVIVYYGSSETLHSWLVYGSSESYMDGDRFVLVQRSRGQ